MNFLVVLITFILMEGATWLIHKYVMHGFLWSLHKDHHDHSTDGPLEKNDYFFVIFASIDILLLAVGIQQDFSYLFYIGLGIIIYGMAYFFVHDIFIHQRIGLFRNTQNPYLLAIRRAHKQHHKHMGREDGECFGFLWAPLKYLKLYLNKQ
ncbi:MAG TPA: sterol desaturase family protein [Saprospiraceae bacterium]|nr:sterol desaturase family protein [Saprospiraceae bacterium]HQW55614.1 sterol desaturase family protein [Saprospiraceae bacterium]